VKQISELNQSNDTLTEEIEANCKRIKELENEIAEYHSKLDARDLCINEEVRSKESILRQLELAQKALRIREDEYSQLQRAISDKTIELNFIQANTAKMKSTNDALSRELADLRSKLEASDEQHANEETQMKKLQAEAEHWRAKESQNMGELEKIRKELREVSKSNQDLKRGEYKAKQNLEKLSSQRTRLLTELRDMENKYYREKTMKEELSREREGLAHERDSLMNAKNHYETQLQALGEEKRSKDAAYDTLSTDFKKLRKALADVDAERVILESKIVGLQRENENLKSKLVMTEQQTAARNAAAVNWQRQLKSAELDSKAQLREIDRLRKEKLEYSKVAAENMESCDDLKQKVKLLDHRIQLLSENIARQEDDLNVAQKTIFNTKAMLEKKTEESLALRKTESELRKSFSKALSTQKQLEQEMTKMGIQSKHHTKLLDLVQRERDTLMGHLTQRNDQLLTLMQERQVQEKVLVRSEKDYAEKMMEIQSLKRYRIESSTIVINSNHR
jgi:chromosome segregation ATPase